MTQARREQIFTGVVVAFLLLASALDARLTVAVAVGLLVVGVLFLRNRARGLLSVIAASAVAISVVALVRMLT